jgi:hypothetical protein
MKLFKIGLVSAKIFFSRFIVKSANEKDENLPFRTSPFEKCSICRVSSAFSKYFETDPTVVSNKSLQFQTEMEIFSPEQKFFLKLGTSRKILYMFV